MSSKGRISNILGKAKSINFKLTRHVIGDTELTKRQYLKAYQPTTVTAITAAAISTKANGIKMEILQCRWDAKLNHNAVFACRLSKKRISNVPGTALLIQ